MTTARRPSSAKEPENLQPHSPEAESAALTAALQDPEAAKKVSELSPAHFYDDHRREIFVAIQSLVARREAVNVLTVYQELQARDGIAKEIPITAIHDLEAAPPAVGYLATTVACLHKEARRRALIAAGTKLVEKTRENGRDEAELLGDFWEATKSLDIAGPVPMAVIREGDDFKFSQDSLGVEIQVARVRDGGEGIQGELTVSLDGRALHWGRANLASLSAREALATKLRRSSTRIPWADILEQVCRGTTEAVRATEPTVQLVPAYRTVEPYVIGKLIPDRETSVLFGDGGIGKSLVAKSISLSLATKTPLPGGLLPRQTGPVFYLD
ncbi:MAG: DnaB-like helicase N-terminal domain-containing protein [Candidatus Methylomirabilota bacterium]|jgi:hypothetical protein